MAWSYPKLQLAGLILEGIKRNKETRQGFTNATEGFFILTAGHSCILHITSKYITVHIPIYHYKPWFTEQIHPSKHSHFKNCQCRKLVVSSTLG